MTDRRIRRVVILGGGTAGWMTAAALAKVNSPPQFDIVLLESEEIGTVGVGEATIPTIHWFNRLADVNEAELLRETRATYKLGIEFLGWNGAGSRYFHPFGRYGGPHDASLFYHRWIREELAGSADSHHEYSLSTQAAWAGRFAAPAADPDSILATLGYAYHFDAGLYAACLRRRAQARGVRRIEGRVTHVQQHPESGFITSLTTHRGETLEGDLFIDCSGLRALLIEGTLESGFEDWSHWLPCDRALAAPSTRIQDPIPHTRATAHEAGWQWRIPLQHRTGNGIVYCSGFISDAQAADTLLTHLDGQVLAEPRLIRFLAGRRRRAWDRNVIAIGLSAGFLEPLESTSIHLIQSGIAKFLSLFPTRDCAPETAEQFNRVFAADFESVRDFLVLHYHCTDGRPEPMWRHCRHMAPPDSLVSRLSHFTRSGRIVLGTDELFKEASWFAVMIGQGLRPGDYNPLLDCISAEDNRAHLQRIRRQISAALATMGRHEDHLQAQLRNS
ncbi:MAG TPA: tryptophan halogenase family protein [Steroidobacteraceae bacterium]|nr:tryptophan halogenase family protein [Steroidobacteraceae bacterium]